jgi:hypothetical protein
VKFGPAWTPAEDDALRAAYSTGGLPAARAAIPGRSAHAINNRAHRLGVLSSRRWTEDDDNRLRWLWGNCRSLVDLARQLKRTPSACHARAGLLGLRARCPQGAEPLTRAADRAGFSPPKLVKVLKWAGVPLQRSFARPGLSRGLRRQRFVDKYDVDVAVAQWVRAA